MLDKNREVLSPSVPSRCWHSSFAPYQAAYVRLPSPSIHPCSSVPSRHTGTEDRNTLPEKLCQEEKVEKLVEIRQIMQREEGNRTFSAFLLSAERIHRSGGIKEEKGLIIRIFWQWFGLEFIFRNILNQAELRSVTVTLIGTLHLFRQDI